jgi:hypothetical protein
VDVVRFAEFDLQIIALSWLVLMYVIKSFQLMRLPLSREKLPRKGNALAGTLRSYAAMFMPWSMESSRKNFWRWFEFAAYHVGAFVAILATFTIPFFPGMMTVPVRIVFAILVIPAAIVGVPKIIRRFALPEYRLISTPDDYFSLFSVELYFVSAILALIFDTTLLRTIYFFITAGFLFYVPFSKISHYIYFFFAGAFTGGRYGWRGVRPETRQIS